MALNPRLELRAQQRLSLTPAVRLRLSVLRMSAADLAEDLAREAARNPFLRVEQRPQPATLPLADSAQTAPALSFHEDLRRQILHRGLPRLITALALMLIGELRDDGFLDVPLEALAREHGHAPGDLDAALTALQSCDPPGIGARSVGECLRLQLVDLGLSRADAAATVAQLSTFARQDWRSVGAALGLDADGVQARAALLRGLTARPIPDDATQAAVLVPDLRLVRVSDGTLRIEVESRGLPLVGLDAAMVRRAETEGFAADLLERARAWLAAIAQRGQTMARIGGWLVQTQAGFFHAGPAALAPATRRDLADALGLHPSTITRALQGKAIDVDGRLWPLSVFFSAALPGASGPVSARAVQRLIVDLIGAEDPLLPISDETLVGMLHAQGVDIARRTVTKYRQGLRIPPSSTRRRLAAARRGE